MPEFLPQAKQPPPANAGGGVSLPQNLVSKQDTPAQLAAQESSIRAQMARRNAYGSGQGSFVGKVPAALITQRAPVTPNYAPKGFWGNVGDSAEGLVNAIPKFDSTLTGPDTEGTKEFGRQLWSGAKAMFDQLPDNYADQGVTDKMKRFGGSFQNLPIGYNAPNGESGHEYHTMAQAQAADDASRTAVKSIPFVGALPSFSDAGHQLYQGDFLNAGGNALGGVLSLSGAGSMGKGMASMAARSAARGGISEASALAIRDAAANPSLFSRLVNTPTTVLAGNIGATGRLNTLAAPASKYFSTVGKGLKEVPLSAMDAAKEIGSRAVQGSSAFKRAIGSLASGNYQNAGGKALFESGRHFGAIPSNIASGLEHIGGAAQSAVLNPAINIAPRALRGGISNFVNSHGQLGAGLAQVGLASSGASPTAEDWLSRLGFLGNPTPGLTPMAGGLKDYVATLVGHDFDAAKRQQFEDAYKQAPHWDSMLGSGKGMQYQSAHPVSQYQGLSANANSAFRHPFSTANTQYPTQAALAQYLNQNGIKWDSLPQDTKIKLWQHFNEAAGQDFNDQNYRTDPANYR